MTQQQAIETVADIFSLYELFGSADYIGEPVSQIEHMCQAAELAEAEGYDEEVILAAFFHDIGHLCEYIMPAEQMNGYGVVDHEVLAGTYLREKGFSERVAKLAESHVLAKRYLTFKYPAYFERLSVASRETLQQQGGVMNAAEAAAFESDPLHTLFIKLREWDDLAKQEHKPLPSLQKYKDMAIRHLSNNLDHKTARNDD
ncbi:HDIG domain-containing protein [Pseudoflavitalea sp. G-6-1-2]|uniref:HDIG domain-containing metalloprotein n=1 Tax=Pseudoflavitalea sp. G-6-1-2 TaxID=2728841 RepID=UPI00146C6836|nr:HDIG domain-containing metalloprotein [Pseudoflavitalea sp. G-6-1-2]NML23552.1 HDIG domain-containing protein [Pseudoflavitalea sp. G-6-1-2]